MARFNALRAALLLALAACTPGGTAVPNGGGTGGGNVTTIDVNLTLHGTPQVTPQGQAAGFSPLVTTVSVGTNIRFTNSDTFAHTASFISSGGTFPGAKPFDASALGQSGTALSQGWSSGSLAAGVSSQTIFVDKAGTYLYGCFYHYSAPMRGVIVAQ